MNASHVDGGAVSVCGWGVLFEVRKRDASLGGSVADGGDKDVEVGFEGRISVGFFDGEEENFFAVDFSGVVTAEAVVAGVDCVGVVVGEDESAGAVEDSALSIEGGMGFFGKAFGLAFEGGIIGTGGEEDEVFVGGHVFDGGGQIVLGGSGWRENDQCEEQGEQAWEVGATRRHGMYIERFGRME